MSILSENKEGVFLCLQTYRFLNSSLGVVVYFINVLFSGTKIQQVQI
jgi:hypothetical protein